MIKKSHIDQWVMSLLDNSDYTQVSTITGLFLEVLANEIVQRGEVQLPNFGTFKLGVRRGKRAPTLSRGKGKQATPHDKQYVITFKKSAAFRQKIVDRFGKPSEEIMEKYAVDEEVDQEQLEKKANEGCPKCGRTPDKHGKTLICPKDGSEPFEQKR